MKTKHIAIVPGDVIGSEVADAVRSILTVAAADNDSIRLEFTNYSAGHTAFLEKKDALPEETLAGIRASDAAFLGGLSGQLVPSPSPAGRLRKSLDPYAAVL